MIQANSYELTVKEISLKEHFMRYDSYVPVYAANVTLLMQKNNNLLSTADVLKTHGEIKMDAVSEKFSDRYICFDAGIRDGRYFRKWTDLWSTYVIKRTDFSYDYFFALKLSHLDLMEIDSFLDYQLENYYNENVIQFSRFVEVLLRKYKGREILDTNHRRTVKEWIANKKSEQSEKVKIKTKGKKKRTGNDKDTCLTQEQTTLFIYYLQQKNFIRKEDNLRNKEAGEAFCMLTGYSADTIRQTLSKTELQRISTKENLKTLHDALTRLNIAVDADRKTKK